MSKINNSSTNNDSSELYSEIKNALRSVKYGSIEIIVQNKVVTQITVRNIHKTSVDLDLKNDQSVKINTGL